MNYVFTLSPNRYYSISFAQEDTLRTRTVLPVFKTRRDAMNFSHNVLNRGHGSGEWRTRHSFPMDIHMDQVSLICVSEVPELDIPVSEVSSIDLNDRDTIVSLCVNGYGFMVVSEQSGLNLQGVVVVPRVEMDPRERTQMLIASYERLL